MINIVQRLIYPERVYTSTYPLMDGFTVPDECYTLKYEHHFWIFYDGDIWHSDSRCLCGKEELGEEIDGKDTSNH